jgi:trk system potassium uptake protein TrkA
MFVLVTGCGRLSSGLARVLSAQGNDVVVVAKAIDAGLLGADFDGVTVEGDPIDGEVLESAGIGKAEVLVAATPDDVTNAMTAQIATALYGVPLALARMTDPAREAFYAGLGLATVCPTATGIDEVLERVGGPATPGPKAGAVSRKARAGNKGAAR